MFSEEKRLYALELLGKGYDVAEAASLVKCSEYSIRRWRRQMAATGSVWPDAELENGHEDAALRNEELVRVVLSLVEDEPVAFLREHS